MVYAKRIAMDGPAGSGKSTIGSHLAAQLGYIFVDSGILYRAITAEMLRQAIRASDEARIKAAVQQLLVTVAVGNQGQLEIHINQRVISQNLHSAEINEAVSVIAAYQAVRVAVRQLQADLAKHDRLILAGRDIGTVVMPDADLKLYLDASLPERAARRYASLASDQPTLLLAQVIDDLQRRDHHDSTRAESPLKAADDALILMTDGLSISQVVTRVLDAARLSVMPG
ncbi:MAG: (d)CMP kinase [Anaerolineae bacterium]|nr:(d)CMP kinase [Anaerolineae bacterium]